LANAKGRVLTEPTLQVEGYQNLWAAGDCAVEYLTLEERKAIVDRTSAALHDKRVADFMRADPVVVRETDSVGSALKTFQQTAASLLPVVDEAQRCKGWLRLEFAFDLLH
jgi:CBS domain-containing protein